MTPMLPGLKPRRMHLHLLVLKVDRYFGERQLHMEHLAAVARMGVSTLHHQFRGLTTMSPLQYQKRLRLQMARQRMLMDGIDATSAAYEVGYESVSQFNKEYGRFFGQPPMRDIRALRDGKVTAINAA